jgi:hypothetical protein
MGMIYYRVVVWDSIDDVLGAEEYTVYTIAIANAPPPPFLTTDPLNLLEDTHVWFAQKAVCPA